MKRKEAILDVYNLALGIFLIASPWLFGFVRRAADADAWLSGLVIVLCSVLALVAFRDWDEWINLLIGIWLVVSPWLLGFAHTRAMHVSIGVGLVVIYFSGLELWLVHYEPPDRPARSGQTDPAGAPLQYSSPR
jgi:hypothetical protein